MHREPSSPGVGIVDDVVVHEGRRVDELHDRGVEDRAVTVVATETRRHQEHGGADPFPAGSLDVLADFRNQLNLGLHVPRELEVYLLEIGTDWLEDLR